MHLAQLITLDFSHYGNPTVAMSLIADIYSNSTTSFTGPYFGTTPPIPILRGRIQGDTLSPYLLIVFLEPLLRWLNLGHAGYTLDICGEYCWMCLHR